MYVRIFKIFMDAKLHLSRDVHLCLCVIEVDLPATKIDLLSPAGIIRVISGRIVLFNSSNIRDLAS